MVAKPEPAGLGPEGAAMTGVSEPSYSHGASGVPLLGETIGANLRRVAAAHPDREALVDVPSGRRWTYARARRRHRRARPRPARGRDRDGRPGRHLGAELRRVGARCSTRPPRSARSWSTSTRPTAPTSCGYVLRQSGRPAAGQRRVASRPATTAAMVEEVRGRAARTWSGWSTSARPDWDALLARRRERG